MRATGIVRRIDDLGRVVIPKEIRRTMRIREGDPLEIFTGAEGEVVFKKYSPGGELGAGAKEMAEVLYRVGGAPCFIADRDHVIAVGGMPRKDLIERRVTPALEKAMESRRPYRQGAEDAVPLPPLEGIERYALAAAPVITSGDVTGSVVLLTDNRTEKPTEVLCKLTVAAAGFLGKQLED